MLKHIHSLLSHSPTSIGCSSTFTRYCMFKYIHPLLLYVQAHSLAIVCSSTFTHCYCMFKHIHPLLLYVQAPLLYVQAYSLIVRTFTLSYCMFKHIQPLLLYVQAHSPSAIVCSSTITNSFCICLFDLMLYAPVNHFQSCWDNFLSFWVEPVLSSR